MKVPCRTKVVTVSPDIPNPARGGGGHFGSVLLQKLVNEGYDVHHIAVVGKHKDSNQLIPCNDYQGLTIHTVHFTDLNSTKSSSIKKILTLCNPTIKRLFPREAATSTKVSAVIKQIKPDLVVPIFFDAMIYTDGLDVPCVGIQAEGPHINARVKLEFNPSTPKSISFAYAIYWAISELYIWSLQRLTRRLTKSLASCIYLAPHYVDAARALGLKNTQFLPQPAKDPGVVKSFIKASETKTKILMIGHLGSTSNMSGLPLFFEKILPSMETRIGTEGFEVHIVGENSALPIEYSRFRTHPSIKWRGVVYPADVEFLSADIVLVPIPAKTGPRSRIINAFSFGACVVAHRKNQLGLPELSHGDNVLLGESGTEIAELICVAAANPDLRKRLGKAGRSTYEKSFSYNVIMPRFVSFFKEFSKAVD